VVTCPARKLNYRFMAAEALWISAGRNDLGGLTDVNPNMARFSDDGRTLAGAYGPRIRPQVPYVVASLIKDRDTRQAALTIWTPNPEPSKDTPCTVAMVFSIRENRLYQHVFMRSSDAWLGIPYDVFSFTLLAYEVACRYNQHKLLIGGSPVGLGHMTITCTSSHLYSENREAAVAILDECRQAVEVPTVDPTLIATGNFLEIIHRVETTRWRLPGHEPRFPL